jgi:hypothetical protein
MWTEKIVQFANSLFARGVVLIDPNTGEAYSASAPAASTAGGGGGIIGVDTTGTKWLLVANTSATPATITYYKVSDGTVGTPSGGFTPDADQNGLTDAQLRASAVPVSATSLPLPAGAATEASLGTDGDTPPTIAGTGVRGWLRGIYEKLTGTLTVTGPLTNAQLRATDVPVVTPLPTAPITGQLKIVTTGTAVALPDTVLKNGIVIKAKATNVGALFVGASTVTTTDDGTGNGYKLEAGEGVSFAVANAKTIFITGTAGDSIYFSGN